MNNAFFTYHIFKLYTINLFEQFLNNIEQKYVKYSNILNSSAAIKMTKPSQT